MQETVQYYAAAILGAMVVLSATVYGTFYTLSPGADARTKMTLFLYDVATIYEKIVFSNNPTTIAYRHPDFKYDTTGYITYGKNRIELIKRNPVIRSVTSSNGVGHVT